MDDILYQALQQAYHDLDEAREIRWELETRLLNAKLSHRRLDWLRMYAVKAYGRIKNKLDNMSDDELYQRKKSAR